MATGGWKLTNSRRATFVLDQDQFDAVTAVGKSRRTTASAIVREAIDLYLSVHATQRFAPPPAPPANTEQAAD